MSKNKTVATSEDVSVFVESVKDEKKRDDCRRLIEMMSTITGHPAVMWGKSIVGFGQYHYKYDSGREGDFMMTGFSPRAQNMTIYVMPGFEPYGDLLDQLGKHKTGKSCLYIKSLDVVDERALSGIIERSYQDMVAKYGESA